MQDDVIRSNNYSAPSSEFVHIRTESVLASSGLVDVPATFEDFEPFDLF
jgi:hypothetical protein